MKRLAINTILHTRDGRVIGNAIIISDDGECYAIKTDYGNVLRATQEEVDYMFHTQPLDLSEGERRFLVQFYGRHKHAVCLN